MLLILNHLLLLVNAVTLRREFKSIIKRVPVLILLHSAIKRFFGYPDRRVGIFNSLYHFIAIIYIFLTLLLTAFYARRIVQPIIPYNRFEPQNGLFSAEGPGYVKAYRTAGNNSQQRRYCTNKAHKLLNPQYVTGFIDGEGCFYIRISPNKKCSTG
jgi:hypothetical protein